MTPKTCLLTILIFYAACSAAPAQEFPPNYEKLPCPDIGVKALETSPYYYLNDPQRMAALGPRDRVSRCFYENNATLEGQWSENFADKNKLCNDDYFKGVFVGNQYHFRETTPPPGKLFGFTYKKNAQTGRIDIMEVGKNSPAQKGGLKAGDEIIALDGLSVQKFSLREVSDYLKSREEVTFKVHDRQYYVYRNLNIKKEKYSDDYRTFVLASPVHFAMVFGRFPDTGGGEKAFELWRQAALKYLKSFEQKGVVCVDLDVSEKGPVAE